MDVGNGLLTLGVLFSASSALLSIPQVSKAVPRSSILTNAFVIGAFVSVTASLCLIIVSSMLSDFTYRYVWDHSSTDLALVYKLSSVWAGGGGSLLLCAWLTALVLVCESSLRRRKLEVSGQFRSAFTAMMSLLVAFFSITVLTSGLFERTEEALLSSYPDGGGLDLLLQTPEMVVHAPLIFGAYASLCAVFASSASFLLTDERRWHRVGLPWARLAWLLLTAGIVVGAYWAYHVLGWGGYWSWDPVETASLVPWLMLTAFLHTQDRHLRKGEYGVASPMFGMLSLAGVVFVSFVVRAGGLWSASVHDYGVSSGSSAVSRFVELLRGDAAVAGTFVFMITLLTATACLCVRAHSSGPKREQPPAPKRLSGYITDQNNMALAVTILSLAALVAISLMFKNVESDQAEMAFELGQKMTVVAVVLMISMGVCLVWRDLGRGRAMVVSAGLVIVSVVFAIASAVGDVLDPLVVLALPSFFFAILASSARIVKAVTKGHLRTRVFRTGAQIAHLGVAVLLVAFVASSNLQEYPSEGPEVAVHAGAQVTVGDYVVRLVSMGITDAPSGYPADVAQVRVAFVDILEDGSLVEEGVRMEVLYGYDSASGYYVLEHVAHVKSSLTEDLYLSFEWMSDEVAVIHAKVVPMMLPLWVGCSLMVAGLSLRLWAFGPRQGQKVAPA